MVSASMHNPPSGATAGSLAMSFPKSFRGQVGRNGGNLSTGIPSTRATLSIVSVTL
jgi:hypothetical protein